MRNEIQKPGSRDAKKPKLFAASRNGLVAAWLSLCGVFAVHVVDEAANHFPEAFNHNVDSLQVRFPGFPFWHFSYTSWWVAMIVLMAGLLLLLIPVRKGGKAARILARIFGVIMLLNGMAHITNSIIFGNFMPGVFSSPLLIAASVWLLLCSRLLMAAGRS